MRYLAKTQRVHIGLLKDVFVKFRDHLGLGHVNTKFNLADLFTKSLPAPRFDELTRWLFGEDHYPVPEFEPIEICRYDVQDLDLVEDFPDENIIVGAPL